MELVLVLILLIQAFATSLGVGSSTVAIVNFFAAIKDGVIDESERNIMGVTYTILRVAMVAILLSSLFVAMYEYTIGADFLTPFVISQWLLIIVLYGNAILMTLHKMPSTFGPAIQAGSWYTLGALQAFIPLGLTNFSLLQFLIGYVCVLALAVALVNGTMFVLKEGKEKESEA